MDTANFYTRAESDARFATQAAVAALEARITALEAKLAAVTYDDANDVLRITGANVQIVDGTGDTGGTPTGFGNLIVGYNADGGAANVRSGSHNLIIGDDHTYSSFSGAALGSSNAITGPSALAAGSGNTVSGASSSVTGGNNNLASGTWASITGGANNRATDFFTSVTGGANNIASNNSASVTGGSSNAASGFMASVTGGISNTASGERSSISGGESNISNGTKASISGGLSNIAGGMYQWLAGTLVTRTANVSVPGGGAGNGDYATRAATAVCASGEQLFSGGAFWVSEVDDDEHPMISSRANATMTGWSARGGNDLSVDRTLTVQVVCLGP